MILWRLSKITERKPIIQGQDHGRSLSGGLVFLTSCPLFSGPGEETLYNLGYSCCNLHGLVALFLPLSLPSFPHPRFEADCSVCSGSVLNETMFVFTSFQGFASMLSSSGPWGVLKCVVRCGLLNVLQAQLTQLLEDKFHWQKQHEWYIQMRMDL